MNVGGPATLLAEFSNQLNPDEFEHVLITGRCEGNEIDYLDSHSINCQVIYIDGVSRSILPTKDLISFVKLTLLLFQLKPNIVHTHTSKAGVLGRLAALIATPRAKRIHTFHGHLIYGYFSKFISNLIISLEIFLAKISHALIAVSESVASELKDKGVGNSTRWEVIHPGVSGDTGLKLDNAREIMNLPADKFILSWIGRFTEIKDPFLAVNSLSRVNPEILSDLLLVMAGDGELRAECEAHARSLHLPILFLGWTDKVQELLSASNLLLMTSKNEGLPVVMIEAAAKNVPTISTNVGGVGDFISNGINGSLTSQKSEDIARVLEDIIENPSLLETMGSRAKELMLREFSSTNYLAKHVELYKDLLKKN
jgi:glycosyltransferase involved in cell wall biosynthesis